MYRSVALTEIYICFLDLHAPKAKRVALGLENKKEFHQAAILRTWIELAEHATQVAEDKLLSIPLVEIVQHTTALEDEELFLLRASRRGQTKLRD